MSLQLRSVNLNLLPVLRVLLHECGVSRAAHVLSLSQAATSEALAQLRLAFDDPLLVRVGTQMVLTPRAAELRDTLDRVCDDLEALLSRRTFDPARARRTFVIATTDHYVYLLGQQVIQRVSVVAPEVEVQFVNWTSDAADRMAAREIDLCIMPRFIIDDLSPAPVRLKPLFNDRLVLIFASGHPLADLEVLQEADLAPYRQVLFTLSEVDGKRRRSIAIHNDRPLARVWPVLLAPLMLPGTDHLSLVPHSLALRLSRDLPLQWRENPTHPVEVNACMGWSTLMDADAGHHWFRLLVEQAVHPLRPGDQVVTGP